jgi:hypothetical protein
MSLVHILQQCFNLDFWDTKFWWTFREEGVPGGIVEMHGEQPAQPDRQLPGPHSFYLETEEDAESEGYQWDLFSLVDSDLSDLTSAGETVFIEGGRIPLYW